MRQSRDLFKKIGNIKRIAHARMGTIKDRNSKDLTEAEKIKKRWQEYTKELYRNVLMTQITIWCDHSPRARQPGVQSQVNLKKNHYKQS